MKENYIKTTKRTKRLIQLDKQHVWHPFTKMLEWSSDKSNAPIIIERAKGNYLIDTEGRRYIDGTASLWVNVHGHRRKELDSALKAQLSKISHSTLLGLGNVPSIELAKRLVDLTPKGLTRVFYSDNGSTAVEVALKLAFHYFEAKKETKSKKKFIAFTGAYHGDTVGAMSLGEIDKFVKRYNPLLFKSLRAPYPYCYRCPIKKSYPKCRIACLGELEKILKKNHKKIAACIIEPLVQGAAGMITSPPGFLKGVRRLTEKYNLLLISDEVATGFGRTGTLFASDNKSDKISPDIMCLAKGLTGGYMPLAATLATEKIYRSFLGTQKEPDAFYHGHTFTGNQLGSAVALASLDIFKKEKTIKKIQPKIRELARLLEPIKEHPNVGEIRQLGLMVGIELVKNKDTRKPFVAGEKIGAKVCEEATKRGLAIRPLGDTVVLVLPLSITINELRKTTRIIEDSLREVLS
jgi:adenosylmethionine-8-amino-7-oxononanoate aminotransferase